MKSIISMLSVLMLSLVFVACSSTGQATGLDADATNEVQFWSQMLLMKLML